MQFQSVILLFVACLVYVSLISSELREKRASGCAVLKLVKNCYRRRKCCPAETPKLPVNYVFFNHTDGATCNSLSSCCRIVGGIFDFKTKTKKLPDIGYNFLIGGDGLVYDGTGWDKVDNHTEGFNQKSLSIAFIGNYTTTLPSKVMLKTAQNFIECGISRGKITNTAVMMVQRFVFEAL